jgi:hypothetical protein
MQQLSPTLRQGARLLKHLSKLRKQSMKVTDIDGQTMELSAYHIKQQRLQLVGLTMIDLSYILPDMKTNTDNKTHKRSNRFTGQSIMLTKQEASKHDAIFINELAATLEDKTLGYGASKLWNKVRKDLDWFRQHNAEAYMVLLD